MSTYRVASLEEEREAIKRYFARVNRNEKNRNQFLKEAKILNKTGKIKSTVCILQPKD
jgi:hypothetical protein